VGDTVPALSIADTPRKKSKAVVPVNPSLVSPSIEYMVVIKLNYSISAGRRKGLSY
jgi:hypothetical protein